MNVKLCYPKTTDTPILLYVTYLPRHILWKWNKNTDGVSLQELNLEAHVPMASFKRGLERVNFIVQISRSNFEARNGCQKKKKFQLYKRHTCSITEIC